MAHLAGSLVKHLKEKQHKYLKKIKEDIENIEKKQKDDKEKLEKELKDKESELITDEDIRHVQIAALCYNLGECQEHIQAYLSSIKNMSF